MASRLRDSDLTPQQQLAKHLKKLCPGPLETSTSGGMAGNIAQVNADSELAPSTVTREAFDSALIWMSGLNLSPFKPYFSTSRGAAFNVNSMLVLKALPSASVDLVLTSPPFEIDPEEGVRQRTA